MSLLARKPLRRPSISVRIGVLFAIASTVVLICAVCHTHWMSPYQATSPAATNSLMWLASLAALCLSGLVGMRTTRVARIIEDELGRIASGGEPSADRARLILSNDDVARGWNELLTQADRKMAGERREHSASGHSPGFIADETIAMIRAMRDFPIPWVITDTDGIVQSFSPIAANLLGIESVASVSSASSHRKNGENPVSSDQASPVSQEQEMVPSDEVNLLVALGLAGSTEANTPEAARTRRELLSPARVVRKRWSRTHDEVETQHFQIVRNRLEGRRSQNRTADGAAMVWAVTDITQQQLASGNRDQFLMSAGHELRTPLQNLRAAAETLGQVENLSNDERSEFCNLLVSESVRLGSLVDQLLAVGQMESGSMMIHRYQLDLAKMLGDARDQVESSAAEKSIDVSFEIPAKLPAIEGDRGKLQATLGNLIGNAIKYTPSGGNVSVICSVTEDSVSIAIQDSGIGIREDLQTRVFEKFFRASETIEIDGKSVSGNGLGLAFAQQVARLHGGEITLRSEPEQGSTFELTLPVYSDSNVAGLPNVAGHANVAGILPEGRSR